MDFLSDRCIICQKISETPLKCPLSANTTDIECRELSRNFLENTDEFQSQSYLPAELKLDLSTTTVELLIANRASWYKSYRLKFTTSKLEKAKERQSAKKREKQRKKSLRLGGIPREDKQERIMKCVAFVRKTQTKFAMILHLWPGIRRFEPWQKNWRTLNCCQGYLGVICSK